MTCKDPGFCSSGDILCGTCEGHMLNLFGLAWAVNTTSESLTSPAARRTLADSFCVNEEDSGHLTALS